MSFGKTLKRVMAERGLKSVDLADEVITVQYVSKLVTGRTKSPTWDKAVYIAEKLGMTPLGQRSCAHGVQRSQKARQDEC